MKRFVFMAQDVTESFDPRIIEVIDHSDKMSKTTAESIFEGVLAEDLNRNTIYTFDEAKPIEITKYDDMVGSLKRAYDDRRPAKRPERQLRGQVTLDDLLTVLAMIS